ncbi:MAG: magnesium transporter [Parvularculales bacterium]
METLQTSEDRFRERLAPVLELVDGHDVEGSEAPLRSAVTSLQDAEIAHLLEMLPPRQRTLVWNLLDPDIAADALYEVTDSVAESLIQDMEEDRLVALCRMMDPEALNEIVDGLTGTVVERLRKSLPPARRRWLDMIAGYPEETVGRYMSPDMLVIGEASGIQEALTFLRGLDSIPDHTDQLFVIDEARRLVGVLPLTSLLTYGPEQSVADIMTRDPVYVRAGEELGDAALAFERYDLISAPVVDRHGQLMGRLTVDRIMDVVREESEEEAFNREGLPGDEDILGRVFESARRRWLWLCLNLMTAFFASRVISLFEEDIERLVALATLMPIVASIAGNTGNQTIALMVRGLALGQIGGSNVMYLFRKELMVALVNGLLWGGVMGLITFFLYGYPLLGGLMTAAITLNLLVAALVGVAVPLMMERLGRDPALGVSVILTFVTDSFGFLIFLGLAALFLPLFV